ncbi:myo-inositol transporter [Aspergillus hancockii]|nr:myo-inositol transporter [Aspergillus hancockii]
MDSESLNPYDNKTEIFYEDLASSGLDDSIEETYPGKTVWLIVCAVSMGGSLHYDMGVISAVDAKARLIRHPIEEATSSVSDKSLLWQMRQLFTVGPNVRAPITACAVMAVSQLGGFNTLMYYCATLFSMVGFDKPTVVSIVVGATNFIFGFPNFTFIDRFGRRRMLLVIVLGMASLLLCSTVDSDEKYS